MLDRRRCLAAAAGSALAALAGRAAADPGDEIVSEDVRFAGDRGQRLRCIASASGDVRAVLHPVGLDLAASGGGLQLHRGADVRAALAVRPEAALVALVRGGRDAFIRFSTVPLASDGGPSGAPVVLDATARRTGADGAPVAVAACPDPGGFTVLWQELVGTATRPDARTYFARVGSDGREREAARVVDVPWSLAAVAHNGRGYHLALYYSGGGPSDTRLSVVTLDPTGRPEQHPWWASAPQLIAETQLAARDGRVVACWRGGADGTSLRSADVTAVHNWGEEPAAPEAHGALALERPFALRLDAARVAIVR